MVKYISFLAVCVMLFACGHFNLLNGENPKRTSFKYYNKDFKLSAFNTNLKMNRKYFHKYNDSYVLVLVFFEDGFLNSYYTSSVDSVPNQRVESGATMGYFDIKGDSIFFTTKSFYEPRPSVYRGIITNEAMVLNVKYPTGRDTVVQKFLLYQ